MLLCLQHDILVPSPQNRDVIGQRDRAALVMVDLGQQVDCSDDAGMMYDDVDQRIMAADHKDRMLNSSNLDHGGSVDN